MAKKIQNMNKAELIVYAKSMDIDVHRGMTVKQIIACLTEPVELSETPVIGGEQANAPAKEAPLRLKPKMVRCAACGRFIIEIDTELCPDCKLYHCRQDAASGTCVRCGLEFDVNLREKKDDNESEK